MLLLQHVVGNVFFCSWIFWLSHRKAFNASIGKLISLLKPPSSELKDVVCFKLYQFHASNLTWRFENEQSMSCLFHYRPQTKFGGKVIFSQACVKNSVHRGGCLVPGGLSGPGGGGSGPRGCLVPGVVWRPPVTATAVGGTHPTGMHSSWKYCYILNAINFFKQIP